MTVLDAATLQERIDALRARGAARLEPVRFHFLESLARRLPTQTAGVHAVLHEKLQAALADCEQRVSRVPLQPVQPARPPARRAAPAGPLAELTQQLRAAAGARATGAFGGAEPDANELASAQRFGLSWSHARTLDRVAQALDRKPAQSGPLNSHALVLQSLAIMRDLSPDYLRRFVIYVESLQWLEQAATPDTREPGKMAVRTARGKRPKK
jgi:hypothetical protein